MVEGGRMLLLGLDLIKALDASVNPIINGLVEAFDHGSAGGAFFPNNFDPRRVNEFSHDCLLFNINLEQLTDGHQGGASARRLALFPAESFMPTPS
jgi:hypothetical protein